MSAFEINKNRAFIRSIKVASTYYIKVPEIIFNFHKSIIKKKLYTYRLQIQKKTCT